MPVTILLRAIGYSSNDEIMELFADVDNNPDHQYLRTTLEKEPTKNTDQAIIELYHRLRPGDPPTRENAQALLENLFFNPRRYDLAKVGRYKLNKRLGLEKDIRTLTKDDIISILKTMIRLNNEQGKPDDIDHLGNRRIRAVGELIQIADAPSGWRAWSASFASG